MAKKPWRPIQVSEDTGRFTRRQAEDAIRAVKERNQARNKAGGRSADGQFADKGVTPKSLRRES